MNNMNKLELLRFYCWQLNIIKVRELKSLIRETGYEGVQTLDVHFYILGALYNGVPKDRVLNYLKEVL